MKYFILGAVPPPLGGVSIYCYRKIYSMKIENKDVELIDSRSKSSLVKLVFKSWFFKLIGLKFNIEVNVSNPVALLFLFFSGLSNSCTFYDHNGSRRLLSSRVGRLAFKIFMRNVSSVKVVNNDLLKFYAEFSVFNDNKVDVSSPFLPPTLDEIHNAREKYPKEFFKLIEDGKKDIVLCSAWMPISSDSEPDLYGINDTLSIFEKAIKKYSDFTFVLMIGEFGVDEFSINLKKRIELLSMNDNFIFITGGYSQIPMLKRTAVLIRLTKTDGDSVSIREALQYNVQVIATDVIHRPDGVCCVPLNDLNTTYKRLENFLNLQKEYS